MHGLDQGEYLLDLLRLLLDVGGQDRQQVLVLTIYLLQLFPDRIADFVDFLACLCFVLLLLFELRDELFVALSD